MTLGLIDTQALYYFFSNETISEEDILNERDIKQQGREQRE